MPIELWEENRKIDACKNEEKFLIQTCSQAKTSSTKLPEGQGVGKELNPNLRPQKQHAITKKGITEKLHIGQGRAGLRRKHADCINQPSDVTRRISERSKITAGKTNNPQHTNTTCNRGINNDKSFSQMSYCIQILFVHLYQSKQNEDKIFPTSQDTSINLDIEENTPFQDGVYI